MKSIDQTSDNASLGKRQSEGITIFNPIHYKAIGKGNCYEQDVDYFKQPSFETEPLPIKVHLEYCSKAKVQTDHLLTFQNQNGFMKALTVFCKTIIPDWYYGDMTTFAESQTISNLVLIQFSPDRSLFRLYQFESLYPEWRKGINTIIKVIQELIRNGNPPKQVLQTIIHQQSNKGNQEAGSKQSLNTLRP